MKLKLLLSLHLQIATTSSNHCSFETTQTSTSHLYSQSDADEQDQVGGDNGGVEVQGPTLVTVQERHAGYEHARDNHKASLPIGS